MDLTERIEGITELTIAENDDRTLIFAGRKEGAPRDWARQFNDEDIAAGAIDEWVEDRRAAVEADEVAYAAADVEHHATSRMNKAELTEEAGTRGIDVDGMTVPEIREALA